MPTFSYKAMTLLGCAILSLSDAICRSAPGGGPPNDDCSTVQTVALANGSSLTFSGDNTGATVANDWAAGSQFGGSPVVWHAFTTNECNTVAVSYCGQSPVWTNTFGILFTVCPADTPIFPDIINTTSCPDGNSTYVFNNLPAGTYLLPVLDDPGAGSSGPYDIEVSAVDCAPVLVNDLCASISADPLAIGNSLTFTGDNTNATSTDDFVAGSAFAGSAVVWHAFTLAACADVSVAYCGLAPSWDNTFGFLSTDCPADNLIFLSGIDSTGCADGNTIYLYAGLQPGTYYVPVLLDPGNNALGPYSIEVSAEDCITDQGSDFCTSVIPIVLDPGTTWTFSGDNSAATPTGDFVTNSPFAGAPVVWHAFTIAGCSDVTVSYCGLVPTWDNTLGILGTACPVDTFVFASSSNTDDCTDGNVTYLFNGLEAGDYYLPVLLDTANNAVGPYDILVSVAECPSTQGSDFCSVVIPDTLVNGTSLTFTGDNTNASPDDDFAAGSPFVGASVVWHAFELTACADVVVGYCGMSPVWGNTFGFLAQACPGDDLLFYDDTDTTSCGDGNTSYAFNGLQPGTYYLPVLLDPSNDAEGPYTIEVSAEDCITFQGSDFCNQVIPLLLNPGDTLNFDGDNSNATPTADFVTNSQFAGAPVVWHAFTLNTCATVAVAYCGQSPTWDNTLGILGLVCPVDSVVFASGSNTTDCSDGNVTYFFEELSAGSYYLPILLDAPNNAEGPYTVEVVATACPSTQGTDLCADAVPVLLPSNGTYVFNGDNTNATPQNDWDPGNPFFGAAVVWHGFILDQCEDLTISLCGQSPVWEGQYGILTTACPADAVVLPTSFNTVDCGNGNITYFFDELLSGTYYFPVVLDTALNSVGPYALTMETVSCSPLAANGYVDKGNLVVVPNPNNGSFLVSGLHAGDRIVVLDISGRVISSASADDGSVRMDLGSAVSQGTYVVRVAGAWGAQERLLVVR